jgi:hypothetical protein
VKAKKMRTGSPIGATALQTDAVAETDQDSAHEPTGPRNSRKRRQMIRPRDPNNTKLYDLRSRRPSKVFGAQKRSSRNWSQNKYLHLSNQRITNTVAAAAAFAAASGQR